MAPFEQYDSTTSERVEATFRMCTRSYALLVAGRYTVETTIEAVAKSHALLSRIRDKVE